MAGEYLLSFDIFNYDITYYVYLLAWNGYKNKNILNSLMFTSMYMNRNSCRSHKKITRKEKLILEYPEFDYQRGSIY